MKTLPIKMAGRAATITLNNTIDAASWDAETWRTSLNSCLSRGATSILLRINSPGGSVSDALAVYDLIRASKIPVTALICGTCASAATIIALACSRITMTPNSTFMTHEPTGAVAGTLAECRAYLKHFTQCRGKIYAIYSARTGLPVAELEQQNRSAQYYDAPAALAAGYIDAIQTADPAEDENETESTPAAEDDDEDETAEKETAAEAETEEPPAEDETKDETGEEEDEDDEEDEEDDDEDELPDGTLPPSARAKIARLRASLPSPSARLLPADPRETYKKGGINALILAARRRAL